MERHKKVKRGFRYEVEILVVVLLHPTSFWIYNVIRRFS